MRRGDNFHSILSSILLLSLKVRLCVSATVVNKSSRAMPVSFGFHPAFRWPLPYGGLRQDHEIIFQRPESAPIRRFTAGLPDRNAGKEIFEGRNKALHSCH